VELHRTTPPKEEPCSKHIVLLKLKPGTTDREVTKPFQAAERLVEDTPGMIEFAFGRDRSNPRHGYGVASIVQFRDEAALRAYFADPAGQAYVEEHVTPHTQDRIEIDVGTEGTLRPTPNLASWYWGSARMVEDLA
jgi:quinol monooxygenase YgiN